MPTVALIALVLVLAFLVESMIEYIFGTPMDHFPVVQGYKWILMYLALLVAVGLSFFYRLDLVAEIARSAGYVMTPSWVGILFTGLIIGRGANYASDFVSKYLLKK